MADDKLKEQHMAMVRVAVMHALKAGNAADDIAKNVAVELGDTSAAKVRVANALRREGYLLAVERVRAIRHLERCLTPEEILIIDIAVTRVARWAPGESDS